MKDTNDRTQNKAKRAHETLNDTLTGHEKSGQDTNDKQVDKTQTINKRLLKWERDE